MQSMSVPVELRDRLGQEGTLGLLDLLESSKTDWSEDVLNLATERFERRLVQEISSLRVEFHEGLMGVRHEMATTRVELFKWSFVFWVGQVAAIAGLLAFMLGATGR